MSSSVLPHYIPLQQAADQTGLSYYFLRQLVINGEVQHIKSGVKYLINEAALCEYLSEMEQEKGADNA